MGLLSSLSPKKDSPKIEEKRSAEPVMCPGRAPPTASKSTTIKARQKRTPNSTPSRTNLLQFNNRQHTETIKMVKYVESEGEWMALMNEEKLVVVDFTASW